MDLTQVECDAALRAHLVAGVRGHTRIPLDTEPDLRRAAVALVVVDEGTGADIAGIPAPTKPYSGAALILTRRAASLRAHAGQWALPGGRVDPGETAEEAALRELAEEVGLRLPNDAIIGSLDDFRTRSGFLITPLIVWGGLVELQANPAEVASIHRIPLREFLRPDAPLTGPIPESDRMVLRMPVGDDSIAAPTAALLYQFAEVALRHRSTRVAHFEQPVFAWN